MPVQFALSSQAPTQLALPQAAAAADAAGQLQACEGVRASQFAWQHSALASRPLLLAFMRAPIPNVSVLGEQQQQQPSASSSSSQQDNSQPRFPPWKQLGLTPSHGSTNRHHTAEQGQADEVGCLAIETDSGRRRRVYKPRGGVDPGKGRGSPSASWEGFDITQERRSSEDHLRAFVHAYLLPNGFPESVAPQYASYMAWRGVQYFFGGAMSVFTTKSLLGALGVAGKYTGEAAAAINWVIKDGAGRLGRLLFARWGRELDCELKQFRLAGKCGG